MPSPRKGLLSLTSQKKISLKDLPVLPNDITGFTASTINLNKTYDVITNLDRQRSPGVVAPDQARQHQGSDQGVREALGVDINKDLFGSFGDVMVSYSSPSDGFLGTGAVVAIQIKDGKKMEQHDRQNSSRRSRHPLGR